MGVELYFHSNLVLGYLESMKNTPHNLPVPMWEVVLLLVLSAITYYRRELSSNRVYHNYPPRSPSGEVRPNLREREKAATGGDPYHLNLPASLSLLCMLKGGEQNPIFLILNHSSTIKAFPGKFINEVGKMMHVASNPSEGLDWISTITNIMAAASKEKEQNEWRNNNLHFTESNIQDNTISLSSSPFLPALPQDIQLQVLKYLQPQEILQMTQCNRSSRKMCDGDMVWRMKWMERFGEIWHSALVKEVLDRRHFHAHVDGSSNWTPRRGWKRFYSEFELTWLDWLVAGYNSEERCLLGIHDGVYDLTCFLEHHPGSKETILMNAGSDATDFFEDVGHSVQARSLMKDFLLLKPENRVKPCVLSVVKREMERKKQGLEEASALSNNSKYMALLPSSALQMVGRRVQGIVDFAAATVLPWEEEEVIFLSQEDANNEEEKKSTCSQTCCAEAAGGSGCCCPICGEEDVYSFLPPHPSSHCSVAGSPHMGIRRLVYDVIEARWLSWYSCCGALSLQQEANQQEEEKVDFRLSI